MGFTLEGKRKLKLKKDSLTWKQGLSLVEMAAEEVKQITSLHLTFLLWYIVFDSCGKKAKRELMKILPSYISVHESARL